MKKETNTALEARKSLIAKIAQRHASERKLVSSLEVKKSTDVESEYTSMVRDEFEKVLKASTFNPISL
jgi:hypothetical protein